jgi:IS1 family transposase
VLIWTAFARKLGKIVAFVIGYKGGLQCALELYNKTKRAVGDISLIYTDGNSVYDATFKMKQIPEEHIVAEGKRQTHLIEAQTAR